MGIYSKKRMLLESITFISRSETFRGNLHPLHCRYCRKEAKMKSRAIRKHLRKVTWWKSTRKDENHASNRPPSSERTMMLTPRFDKCRNNKQSNHNGLIGWGYTKFWVKQGGKLHPMSTLVFPPRYKIGPNPFQNWTRSEVLLF